MKKINQLFLLITTIGILLASCSHENENDISIDGEKIGPDTYGFGYCSNEIPSNIGVSGGQETLLGAAVHMKADDMIQYGDSLIGIRCGITGSGTDFTVYAVKNLEDDNANALFVKNIGSVDGKTWAFVEFDKPIAIKDAGDLYFAYSLNTTEYALGYEPGSPTDRDWVYAGGWQLLSEAGLNGKFNIQAIVKGGDYSTFKQRYVVNTYLDFPSITITNEKQKMVCYVTNLGVKYVNKIKINFSYGGHSGTYEANNLGLMYGASAAIELPEVITNKSGSLIVSVEVSTNGQTEPHKIEDIQLAIEGGNYNRNILIEHFTGQSCVNCPTGVAAIRTAIEGLSATDQNRIVWVSHHAGYGQDAFTLSESTALANFFQIPGAPYAILNRTKTDSKLGFSFVASALNSNHLNNILSLTSFATVNIAHTYSPETRQLDVTISGISPFKDPKLTVLLTQSGIAASQSGYTGQYTHNHAPRVFLTSTYGNDINYNNGSFSNTFNYTIPASIGMFNCVPEDMEIIAILGNYDATNYTNCTVLNVSKTAVVKGAQINTTKFANQNRVDIGKLETETRK